MAASLTFPVYIGVGSASVHPHVLFDLLAYGIGLSILIRRVRRQVPDVVSPRVRWVLSAAALCGGVLGSHILAAFETVPARPLAGPEFVGVLQGKTIVGGLLGGLVAVELTKKWLGITVATGDRVVFPLVVGMVIGRVGCFLTGLADGTAGVATALPWAIDFGDGVPRHPTQLYEIAFLLGLLPLLARIDARAEQPGDTFKAFLLAYLGFRLAVDFLKPAVTVGALSVLQWIALGLIAYYAPHIPRLLRTMRHV